MLTPLATRWYTLPYSIKANTERCSAVRPCSTVQQFKLSSANTAQTIWELFAQYWEELWPNSPTYQQDFIHNM